MNNIIIKKINEPNIYLLSIIQARSYLFLITRYLFVKIILLISILFTIKIPILILFLIWLYLCISTSIIRYNKYTFYGAYYSNKLVGFISLSQTGFIHHWFLLPNYTRNRIGRLLIYKVINEAKKLNCKKIFLNTTNFTFSPKFVNIIPNGKLKTYQNYFNILKFYNIQWAI
ncbi:hypothetical protein CPAV1605_86 [seawater metagenome]|uniref:N-acetyltransferase domain-containing protein n=1 Tax=seawater metagenome TaxID=1561972 RepID=A0A5E8CI66_9ZZZZ